MNVDKQAVARLTDADIWDIQAHFDRALDTESGSGDHWILMACLNRHGFNTQGTDEAMRLAEEIIKLWYQMQKVVAGDVIKIHNWFGVVLETHFDEKGELSIIRVQTARNIFRGHGPEYLDVRMQPDAIQPATLAELRQEIETHQRLLDGALARMLAAAEKQKPMPVAAD